MCVDLAHRGLRLERQRAFPLFYRREKVGDYYADLVVKGRIILELKAVKALLPEMEAQIINYLRVSALPVGYLVNFRGVSLVWRRFVRG